MNELIAYARQFIGVPYYWGGDTPMQGMDCSGFMQEVLAFCGLDPAGDQSAQDLYNHFVKKENHVDVPPGIGALVFYGKSLGEITHISMMTTPNTVIEAAGGTSAMKGPGARTEAIAGKAFIKERPLTRRKDIVAIIMPAYPKWILPERNLA